MPGRAAKITVTERQLETLQSIVVARGSSQGLVQRVRVILLAFQGLRNEQIAEEIGLDRHSVGLWRRRWQNSFERLVNAECSDLSGDLKRMIAEVLSDRPRSGRRSRFTSEQIARIIAVACEKPSQAQRPISHWTARELADEVVRRKIVECISPRHIARILQTAELRPHHQEQWMTPAPPKDKAAFDAEVAKVCETYAKAPERLEKQGIHTISVDEKCGIQALEPTVANEPMRPGQDERRDPEYQRNGTQTLIAGMEVATGEIVKAHVGDTRTEEDFAQFIEAVVSTDPKAGFIFVADRLNTHMSEKWVLLVVMLCGLSREGLGVKGKSGILKSLESRRKFLSDESHRIRFVYTPRHCSWLNQIEIWFSTLTKKLLKRGVFRSCVDLKEQILNFVKYFNRTMAKPYTWTFKGRPLRI